MPDFTELVEIQWGIQQPLDALMTLHGALTEIDASLLRISNQTLVSFSQSFSAHIAGIRASVQLLTQEFSNLNQAMSSRSGVMVSSQYGQIQDISQLARALDPYTRAGRLGGTGLMELGVAGIGGGMSPELERLYRYAGYGPAPSGPLPGFGPGWDEMRARAQAAWGEGTGPIPINAWWERTQGYAGGGFGGGAGGGGPTVGFGPGWDDMRSRAQDQWRRMTQEAQGYGPEVSNTVDKATQAFLRHLGWITQGVLIWESFRIGQALVRDFAEEFIRLEQVSARLAYITGGQGFGVATAGLAQMAQFGVAPPEATRGLITGAQTGLTRGQQEMAGQLALIYGKDQYVNALQEIYQTQLRANAAGVQHIDVLNFMATAYKRLPLDMERTFDALQAGIALYAQLGLTPEQAGLAVGRISAAAEISPEQAANTLERLSKRMAQPETQAELGKFGIVAGPIPQMFRELGAVTEQLVRSGDTDRLTQLLQLVAGGSLQAGQQMRDFTLYVLALNQAFAEGNKPLENANTLLQNIRGTTQFNFDHLVASFKAYIATLESGIPTMTMWQRFQAMMGIGPLGLLTPQGMAVAVQGLGQAAGGIATGYDLMNLAVRYQQQTGRNPLVMGRGPSLFTPEFQAWAASQNQAAAGDASYDAIEAARMNRAIGIMPPPPTAPDRLLNLPRVGQNQLDMGTFQQFYAGEIEKLRAIPGYNVDAMTKETLALRDQENKFLGMFVGNLQVANEAIRQWQASLKDSFSFMRDRYGGFRVAEPGENIEREIADARKWQAILQQANPAVFGPDQDRYFQVYDPLTKTFHTFIGSAEAWRLAIEENTKALRQITGVFNVPAGGEVLVPFAALSSGFVPSNRLAQLLSGTSGGARPDEIVAASQLGASFGSIPMSDALAAHTRGATRPGMGWQQQAAWEAAQAQSSGATTMSIQNRIIVQIDGTKLMNYVEEKMYLGVKARSRGYSGSLLMR